MTHPATGLSGYCTGSMTKQSISTGEEIARRARCRHCGRMLNLRFNGYSTYLGFPRHKAEEPRLGPEGAFYGTRKP